MKICVPTRGRKGLTEKVYDHFGSAPYFTVYDTETKAVEVLDNSNQHHSHGNCHPLGEVSKYKVEAIMTRGIGKRAVQMLQEGHIKVYLLEGDTVEEAVKKFELKELKELTVENACGGHGCH